MDIFYVGGGSGVSVCKNRIFFIIFSLLSVLLGTGIVACSLWEGQREGTREGRAFKLNLIGIM